MLLSLIKLWDERIAFPIRFRELTKRLSPQLEGARRVLDLGSSDGRLASRLAQQHPRIEMLGADVYVQPETFIPVIKYDGAHLPFPDNSFDLVMLIDVLHHDEHLEQILAEAKRVARKTILIKDHYWNTRIDFWILSIADYIGNQPYGVRLPYNYLRIPAWHELFNTVGLALKKTEIFRFNFFDPVKQVIYVLEK